MYIAINLKDFHKREKKWQGGEVDSVRASVIHAKNLEAAKRTAQMGNNDAWYVTKFNNTKNIIYAKV